MHDGAARDSWVTAGAHHNSGKHQDEGYDDEEEDEEEEDDDEDEEVPSHSILDSDGGLNGEHRGRTQEAVAT